MEVVIVSTRDELEEVEKVLDARADYISGDISEADWEKQPKAVWLGVNNDSKSDPQFWVCDNRSGDCFYEEFETIDGAIQYAVDIHMTNKNQEDWDKTGMLAHIGSLVDAVKGD